MPLPDRRIAAQGAGGRLTAALGWASVLAVMLAPVALAAFSPYLASRTASYILGGFAGIACLALLVLQPLLPAGYLAGSRGTPGRRWHRWLGTAIVAAVALHVGGLYVASPEDTIDALLLVSPTPFSIYGVLAMAGVAATALLVLLRRRLGLRPVSWRLIHNGLAAIVVAATVIHALQIEGAMEPVSKWILCAAAIVATGVALADLRIVRPLRVSRKYARKREADSRDAQAQLMSRPTPAPSDDAHAQSQSPAHPPHPHSPDRPSAEASAPSR